ncbi:hypothetical protein Droror1_Dr00019623 [Drosera rotundifolia]
MQIFVFVTMEKVYKLDFCQCSSSSSESGAFPVDPMTRSLFERDEPFAFAYNERVCVCDTVELQAKMILWQATREQQARMKKQQPTTMTMSLQLLLHDLQGPSMKRSLKLFLRRRKKRHERTTK